MTKEDGISLREYFDNRFNELRQYMDIKFDSIEKSTCLAQDNLNTRLETMNEFRNSMKDQASHYITRTEHESLIMKYDADIRVLRESQAEARGKASMNSVYISYVIAFISIIIGIAGLLISF
jgi:hypothetical protein